MLSLVFKLLCFFAVGILLVFVVCLFADRILKKRNQASREAALKIQSDEPGLSGPNT